MTINTIVCFFVLVQAETAPDVKVLAVNAYNYYHLFNSVKRRARISFWKLFSFASVYIKKKMTMLTRILASSVRVIPWTLRSPFLSFFITGGDFVRLRWAYKDT